MDNVKITEIQAALNNLNSTLDDKEKPKYKYYVYALCEKTGDGKLIPFYIGKGQDHRVWDHEEIQKEEAERIKEEIVDQEEREAALARLPEKLKRIGAVDLKPVIIKWGMTEDEALMAESALINLLRLDGLPFFSEEENRLTNIVNGHASVGEKAKGNGTRALTEEEFYEKNARPPLELEKLKKTVLVSQNKTYPECRHIAANAEELNELVREASRAFWKLEDAKAPEYLFAIHEQRVVGVYRIKKKTKRVQLKRKAKEVEYYNGFLDLWDKDYPKSDKLPGRKKDNELAALLYDACEKDAEGRVVKNPSYNDLNDEIKAAVREYFGKLNADETYENKLKNMLNRKYFVLEDIAPGDEDADMKKNVGARVLGAETKEGGETKRRSAIPPRSYIKYSTDLVPPGKNK